MSSSEHTGVRPTGNHGNESDKPLSGTATSDHHVTGIGTGITPVAELHAPLPSLMSFRNENGAEGDPAGDKLGSTTHKKMRIVKKSSNKQNVDPGKSPAPADDGLNDSPSPKGRDIDVKK